MRIPALLFAMALIGAPALAQDTLDPAQGEEETIQVESTWAEAPPEQFRVNQRPPIPFEPFPRIDPVTRKPITSETHLTFPDGRVVNANAYYDELDRFEKNLNQLGYSLRGPETEVVLEEAIVDEEEFRRAESRLRQMKVQIGKVESEHRELLREAARAPVSSWPAQASSATVGNSWPIDWSAGDEDVFAVSLAGRLTLTGTNIKGSEGANLKGEASMGGSAFDSTFSIVKVSTEVKAPKVGKKSAEWHLIVLDKVVAEAKVEDDLKVLLPPEVDRRTKKALQRNFDKHTSYHFSLGGIPLTASAGVLGAVKLEYEMSATSLSAIASLKPSVIADVYFQVGVDFLVAGGGAGADMTLLDAALDLYGNGQMNTASGSLSATAACYYTLEALSGRVYAYVYVYVPKKWPPFYKKILYRKDFWPGGVQNGIRDGGQLFYFRGLLRSLR